MHRVLLDASVIIAACGNPKGGSALVLELAKVGYCRAYISARIINEARVNISQKMSDDALVRLYQYLADAPLVLVKADGRVSRPVKSAFPKKDFHVVEAAMKAKVEIVLTLDRKDFFNAKVKATKLPFRIMTQGMFLQSM